MAIKLKDLLKSLLKEGEHDNEWKNPKYYNSDGSEKASEPKGPEHVEEPGSSVYGPDDDFPMVDVPQNQPLKNSSGEDAAEQAHELDLVSKGWGNWADPTGKTVAHTVDGHLVKNDSTSNDAETDATDLSLQSLTTGMVDNKSKEPEKKKYSNVAAQIRQRKEAHPEQFCSNSKCLWRIKDGYGKDLEPCKNHPLPQNKPTPSQVIATDLRTPEQKAKDNAILAKYKAKYKK